MWKYLKVLFFLAFSSYFLNRVYTSVCKLREKR